MKDLYYDLLNEITLNDESKIKKVVNVSAGVITREDENGTTQVLLIQRASDDHWPNHWEFPRGKCDNGPNEPIIKCLKREIKEEVGLDVKVGKMIDTFEYIADEGTRKSICYNFQCELRNQNQPVKLSKEHQDYKWISEVGQVELLVMPEQKKTIEKVLNDERSIVSYPSNDFTKNNKIEEYLNLIQ